MPRNAQGRYVKQNLPAVKVEKGQLLSVEAHPTIGRIERWQMSDGTVLRVEVAPE